MCWNNLGDIGLLIDARDTETHWACLRAQTNQLYYPPVWRWPHLSAPGTGTWWKCDGVERLSWIVEYVQYIICIKNRERDHIRCSNEQFLCSLAKVKECVYESKNRFKYIHFIFLQWSPCLHSDFVQFQISNLHNQEAKTKGVGNMAIWKPISNSICFLLGCFGLMRHAKLCNGLQFLEVNGVNFLWFTTGEMPLPTLQLWRWYNHLEDHPS